MKKKIINLCLGLLLCSSMTSCLDLDEKAYSIMPSDQFYQSEKNVQSAVAGIYNSAAYGFCEYFFYLQEFSADQIAWRTWYGGSWGWDEGLKFVLSSHTWTPEAKIVEQAWESAWTTIGLCNQLVADLSKIDPSAIGMSAQSVDAYIAEVRTLRAWAYYNNYELWGGTLPICNEVSNVIPGSASEDFNEGSQLLYNYISRELDESLVDLENNGSLRVNPAMNRMLKMRLLLNAELFLGAGHAQWQACATLAQELLDGKYGAYSLATDYREIYEIQNENCPEVVFAFAESNGKLNTGWMRNMPFLPYTYNEFLNCYATNQSAWNCCCLAPSFDNTGVVLSEPALLPDDEALATQSPACFLSSSYNDRLGAVYERMEKTDLRRQLYQFPSAGRWNGGMILKGKMVNIVTGEDVLADADRDGQPLVYVDQLGQFAGASVLGRALEDVQSPRWGQTNSGYRLMKYPMYPTETGVDFQNISEVEFRWAEVYYTLAECQMRLGKPYRDLVNEVRKRYFKGAVTDEVTAGWTEEEWMLSQWGLEFLGEGRRRRTDLRRFDRFTQGQWWFFGRARDDAGYVFPRLRDRKYEWYPLPASAISVNPGLKQNPNY